MTGLFLNIFECTLENDYFNLQYLPYKPYAEKEAYVKLRDQNPDYELCKYDTTLENGLRESRIYFWNKKEAPSTTLVGTEDRIDIQTNPKIISKIIESCIIQHFKNFGKFQLSKKKEEHFWNIVSPQDLITNVKGLNAYNEFHFNTLFNSYNSLSLIHISEPTRPY